jgi:hypothetical protein
LGSILVAAYAAFAVCIIIKRKELAGKKLALKLLQESWKV